MKSGWRKIWALGLAALTLAGCGMQKEEEDAALSSLTGEGEDIKISAVSGSESQNEERQSESMRCRTPESERISLEGKGTHPGFGQPGEEVQAFSGGKVYVTSKDFRGVQMLYEESVTIGEYDFDMGFAPDLVMGDRYLSLTGVAQEDGSMHMNLTVYGLNQKGKETIYSAPLTNYRNFLYPINDNAVLFSYNGIEDGEKYEFTGVYNFHENTCKIVSKHLEGVWDDAPTTGQEITSVCASDNRIYFAKEQRIDGEVKIFLTCLDSDGKVLSEEEIPALSERWRPNTNIQWVDAAGAYLFVRYYTADAVTPGDRMKPVVLKKTADGYVEVPLDTDVWFSRRIGSGLIGGRYILFAGTMDENGEYMADFVAFDIVKEDYRLLRFDGDEEAYFRTFADEQGNLLCFFINDQRQRSYFRVQADAWL